MNSPFGDPLVDALHLQADLYRFQIVNEFTYLHDEDLPGAAFKIGQSVRVLKNGHVGKVTGVNGSDDFEYSVEGYDFLVWENELEAI